MTRKIAVVIVFAFVAPFYAKESKDLVTNDVANAKHSHESTSSYTQGFRVKNSHEKQEFAKNEIDKKLFNRLVQTSFDRLIDGRAHSKRAADLDNTALLKIYPDKLEPTDYGTYSNPCHRRKHTYYLGLEDRMNDPKRNYDYAPYEGMRPKKLEQDGEMLAKAELAKALKSKGVEGLVPEEDPKIEESKGYLLSAMAQMKIMVKKKLDSMINNLKKNGVEPIISDERILEQIRMTRRGVKGAAEVREGFAQKGKWGLGPTPKPYVYHR